MPKDSIGTNVLSVNTEKHFIIPTETLFTDLPLCVLWNRVQLRTAMVTRFSWCFVAKISVF